MHAARLDGVRESMGRFRTRNMSLPAGCIHLVAVQVWRTGCGRDYELLEHVG